jgi:hypothetical protein
MNTHYKKSLFATLFGCFVAVACFGTTTARADRAYRHPSETRRL